MSGMFESVQWKACVHKLDLSLHSHSEEFDFTRMVKDEINYPR